MWPVCWVRVCCDCGWQKLNFPCQDTTQRRRRRRRYRCTSLYSQAGSVARYYARLYHDFRFIAAASSAVRVGYLHCSISFVDFTRIILLLETMLNLINLTLKTVRNSYNSYKIIINYNYILYINIFFIIDDDSFIIFFNYAQYIFQSSKFPAISLIYIYLFHKANVCILFSIYKYIYFEN